MTRAASRRARPSLLARLRRFRAEESGSVTVEFVILVPLVFYIFMAGMEVAMWEAREIMLRRATSLAIRDVRISTADPPTFQEMQDAICARSLGGKDCKSSLRIEMRALPLDQWATAQRPVGCTNRTETYDPLTSYKPGAENELMLVSVCRLFEPLLPGAGIGRGLAEGDGEFAIRVVSAFVTEPKTESRS